MGHGAGALDPARQNDPAGHTSPPTAMVMLVNALVKSALVMITLTMQTVQLSGMRKERTRLFEITLFIMAMAFVSKRNM